MDLLHTVIFPYLNFGMFAFVLFWFARKPAARFAKEQHALFSGKVDAAEASRKEMEGKLCELQARLEGLPAEVEKIHVSAERVSAEECAAIQAEGVQVAENLKRDFERFLQTEVAAQQDMLQEKLLSAIRQQAEQQLAGLSREQQASLNAQALKTL